ncbi:MAG: ABZJ_00895 family protein [Shimia sp.]
MSGAGKLSVSLRRYAMWFTGTALAMLLLVLGVTVLLGVQLSGAALTAFPPLVAAMVEGGRYAKSTRAPLPAPWRDAFAMTGVGALIVLVLAAPMIFGLFTSVPGEDAARLIPGLALMAGMVAIVWLAINRFFLTMGARNEWASQDRRD